MAQTLDSLTSQKLTLDNSSQCLGELRESNDIFLDTKALRQRMEEDNYLFIRGFWDRKEVEEGRKTMMERIATTGWLHPDFPSSELVVKDGIDIASDGSNIHGALSQNNPALKNFLFKGKMLAFWTRFLGGKIAHFDNINTRLTPPGRATYPHCDSVYMGRGSQRLFTAWTPYVDIPKARGGLMILEKTHQNERLRRTYTSQDVDAYCANRPNADEYARNEKRWAGRLSSNPVSLREKLGGRWLTTDYQMGDALVFSIHLVHASLDNNSKQFRLTSDSRYQLASEPIDSRHIGSNRSGHGPDAKIGRIC
jgi:hypothetical protein